MWYLRKITVPWFLFHDVVLYKEIMFQKNFHNVVFGKARHFAHFYLSFRSHYIAVYWIGKLNIGVQEVTFLHF